MISIEEVSFDVVSVNLLIRSLINSYRTDHSIGYRQYAKLVGVKWFIIMALQLGIISVDTMHFTDVVSILKFHGYNIYMRVYESLENKRII